MSKYNAYYPNGIGNQIMWLKNWIDKIGNYQLLLAYLLTDIAATVADAKRVLYLLETVQGETQSFAVAMTNHVNLMQMDNTAGMIDIPSFALPTLPAPPANVMPGALKRIFAFVANMKTRPGFLGPMGDDLLVNASTTALDPMAVPAVTVEARSGEVVCSYKKAGQVGVLVQGQTGASTVWETLGVSTSSPYHDVRPLAAVGVPEMRRYRFCFWDNTPTNVWTATFEVTFGG
jgi:hypothetical protein